MASRIQGITVEIGGDTTKLQNALVIGCCGYFISPFFDGKVLPAFLLCGGGQFLHGSALLNKFF